VRLGFYYTKLELTQLFPWTPMSGLGWNNIGLESDDLDDISGPTWVYDLQGETTSWFA